MTFFFFLLFLDRFSLAFWLRDFWIDQGLNGKVWYLRRRLMPALLLIRPSRHSTCCRFFLLLAAGVKCDVVVGEVIPFTTVDCCFSKNNLFNVKTFEITKLKYTWKSGFCMVGASAKSTTSWRVGCHNIANCSSIILPVLFRTLIINEC